MERSNPSSTAHANANANVFDDEYAIDEFDMVADGFAPGRVHGGGGGGGAAAGRGADNGRFSDTLGDSHNINHDDNDDDDDDHEDDDDDAEPAVYSVAAHRVASPTSIGPVSPSLSRRGPTRNSIRKSRDASDNPFRSAEDEDAHAPLTRTMSAHSQSTVAYAPGITHRSMSSASSHAFAAPQSNGPSHPYAMYPQGTNIGRTASISTMSSVRPPTRPLLNQQGPTHPYGLYPQNVSEDADEAEAEANNTTAPQQSNIPVGFPGRTVGFHRQQGPEGEEQDIIGVDGHTEQLPPYSEYPEDGVPKNIVIPGQTTAATTTATVAANPSSSTQLHLPLIPMAPQSMSDSAHIAAAQGFSNMETMDSLDTVDSDSSLKRWSDKTWKEKRKTKFCGIPFWWILLGVCVSAFIAIVCGAVIGGVLREKQKEAEEHRAHYRLPSASSLYDASPIPTSSSGKPPPTGTYALRLGSAEATQAECLTNQSYAQAWDCNIPDLEGLVLEVGYPPGASSGWEGACISTTANYMNLSYGTQPPTTEFSSFIAVQDNDEKSRGPAYYFQSFYDKLVIAPPDAFPYYQSSYKKKRGFSLSPDWHTRHQIAAGEKPWFCYWNSTFLEGFIFVNNSTTETSASASSYVTSTAMQSSSTTPSTSATLVERSSPSSTSATFSSWASATPTDATHHQRRTRDGTNSFWDSLPGIGYVVKLEERRIEGSPQPYCQLMQILDDGTAGVVTEAGTGNPVTITLDEDDPGYAAYQSSSLSSSTKLKRADTVAGGCHCQWWAGA